MNWQFDNNLPIYTQIVYKYRLAIASGELSPGEKLAAVRDLAFQAGVNPNTMQRAFQELERLELVYTQRSSGRFVTEDMDVISDTRNKLAEEVVRRFLSSMSGLGLNREQIIDMINDNVGNGLDRSGKSQNSHGVYKEKMNGNI